MPKNPVFIIFFLAALLLAQGPAFSVTTSDEQTQSVDDFKEQPLPTQPVVAKPAVTAEPRSDVNLSVTYENYTGRKYRLGPNDVLSVSVMDSPEYEQKNITIQPDGKIVLAPLGPINVAGFTMDELHDTLVDRYKTYLNDPQITLKLEHTKPFTVYVTGSVLRPGGYEVITDMSRNQINSVQNPEVPVERKSPLLSNILVAAGGVSHDADLEHVKVINRMDKTSFEINLLELIQDSASGRDLYLIAGDAVHVPRLANSGQVSEARYKQILGTTVFQRNIPVKVYGFVQRPGLQQLESAQSANLNSAIAAAGGFVADNAYPPKKVFVHRMDRDGRLRTITVDPQKNDLTLMPNDIVYVPDKPRPLVGKAFDYATRLIAPVAGVASAYNNWALLFDPARFSLRVRP